MIAGTAGGLRLQGVKGSATRPTADRVKESLFSILAPFTAGARVLDLYAGSGSLGIEALSRGAEHALFIDQSPACVRVIRSNLVRTGLAERADVIRSDVLSALRRLGAEPQQYDLIFVDPPYGKGLAALTLDHLGRANLLAPTGRVAVEHSAKEEMQEDAQNLTLVRRNHYGDTCISLYGAATPAI